VVDDVGGSLSAIVRISTTRYVHNTTYCQGNTVRHADTFYYAAVL